MENVSYICANNIITNKETRMKFKVLFIGLMAFVGVAGVRANDVISLHFNRTGTEASSVAVLVKDGEGRAIEGAEATFTSSHSLKATGNAVTSAIVCPNVNGNASPAIQLTLQVTGLPEGFTFNNMGLDIHALNGGSNYQERADGVKRQWNVKAIVNGNDFGSLTDVDIAAGVNTEGKTHKVWDVVSPTTVTSDGTLTMALTITKGTTNSGCFFGLSEVRLSALAVEPEPEQPTPDDGEAKVTL